VISRNVGIIGAGRMAAETANYLKAQGVQVSFFADEYGKGQEKDNIPHIDILRIPRDIDLIIAVGDPSLKKKLVALVRKNNNKVRFISCICSEASGKIYLGDDVTIAPGCNLTTDIKVGSHVIINIGCNISHDVEIEDFTYVSPGVNIAGYSKIGKGVMIGVGATVIDRVKIGDNVIIGAGAVVIKDVPSGDTVAGVPARSIK